MVPTRADIPRENLLSDPAWQEGYRALAEFGLSFDLLVWPAQLPQAAAIAAKRPRYRWCLSTLARPSPLATPIYRPGELVSQLWLNSRTLESSCRRSAASAACAPNGPCAML
jgi:hypothetical protein